MQRDLGHQRVDDLERLALGVGTQHRFGTDRGEIDIACVKRRERGGVAARQRRDGRGEALRLEGIERPRRPYRQEAQRRRAHPDAHGLLRGSKRGCQRDRGGDRHRGR